MENENFIDEQIRIFDSYPHDEVWEWAAFFVEVYERGYMTATGAAVS